MTSSAGRSRPLLLSARVLLWHARPALLGLGVVVLVLGVARTVAPPPPATAPVVVAAREVPAGATVTGRDLRIAHLPVGAVPDGSAATVDAVVDQVTTSTLTPGLPVVPSLLRTGRFHVDPPEGAVVVPVRLADPGVAALLRPGDRVDLVTTAPDATGHGTVARVVARRALVLQSDGAAPTSGSPMGLASDTALPLVVAVPPQEGRRLAAVTTGLGAVLVD